MADSTSLLTLEERVIVAIVPLAVPHRAADSQTTFPDQPGARRHWPEWAILPLKSIR